MAEPFISQITMYGCNFALRGWAFCAGQLLPISQNTALFSLIGTIYGGDGRTTMALPDLRGRAPIQEGHGPGLSNRFIGQKGGWPSTNITPLEMPSHSHGISINTQTAPDQIHMKTSAGGPDAHDPDDAYFDNFPPGQQIYSSPLTQPAGRMGPIPVPALDVSVQGSAGYTGGGQSWQTQSPYQVVTMQIALQGVFPSRN